MRALIVGDIHAVPEELDDCARLRDFVDKTAAEQKADFTVLLADNHHTHNVIRAEVMAFYRDWFKRPGRRISLVGNHDYAGEGNPIHAMMMYEDLLKVADKPQRLGGVLFMPYYSDRKKFVVDANSFPGTKTLVCHQTFMGSRYENGFAAEDGVERSLIPQENIISGHIHTPQEFDGVKYIGAPRWRSLSDANIERAIWLYEFDAEGNIASKQPFSTGEVCKQIKHIVVTPDDLHVPEAVLFEDCHDWRVDIHGPSDFVAQQKNVWSKVGVRLRTFVTDKRVSSVRESEGISTAFRKYLKDYTPRNGTPIEVLEQMAKERLGL